MADRPGEFEIIARYFRPLAEGNPGALDLADDAAVLEPSPGNSFVVTTDTLIAGVHFFADDSPDIIARKLLRVNLSDLAAMGARPVTYLMALALPEDIAEPWIAKFCEGLTRDQKEFGVWLCGGDTTATPGPATLTITALGEAPKDRILRRSSARPGDVILVSGTIGDAALGLRARRGMLPGLAAADRDFLISRYDLPQPRVELGIALRELAHAAIDVSDGLVADLGHICETSRLGAAVEWPRIPLSPAARQVLATEPALRDSVLSGGDDYELLFTAPRGALNLIERAAADCGVAVSEIGTMAAGPGMPRVMDERGHEIALGQTGYRHF